MRLGAFWYTNTSRLRRVSYKSLEIRERSFSRPTHGQPISDLSRAFSTNDSKSQSDVAHLMGKDQDVQMSGGVEVGN
jgi:hypothetical protein